MIKGIKFTSVPCKDQDRALAFYTERLGFAVATDQPFDGGQRWIELRIPGAETKLVLFTPPGHESRVGEFMAMSFWSEDVQKTYEQLTAKGVEFVKPPQRESWGTSAIFKDSEGNQFVLSSK
jgi:predicted enzyme related to lactoylglutathione lyase